MCQGRGDRGWKAARALRPQRAEVAVSGPSLPGGALALGPLPFRGVPSPPHGAAACALPARRPHPGVLRPRARGDELCPEPSGKPDPAWTVPSASAWARVPCAQRRRAGPGEDSDTDCACLSAGGGSSSSASRCNPRFAEQGARGVSLARARGLAAEVPALPSRSPRPDLDFLLLEAGSRRPRGARRSAGVLRSAFRPVRPLVDLRGPAARVSGSGLAAAPLDAPSPPFAPARRARSRGPAGPHLHPASAPLTCRGPRHRMRGGEVRLGRAQSVGGDPRKDLVEQNLTEEPPGFLGRWLVPHHLVFGACASGLGKAARSYNNVFY